LWVRDNPFFKGGNKGRDPFSKEKYASLCEGGDFNSPLFCKEWLGEILISLLIINLAKDLFLLFVKF